MKFINRITKFFREIRSELRKVHWPDRQELGTYTTVVIVTIVTIGILFGIFDAGFQAVLKLIIQ